MPGYQLNRRKPIAGRSPTRNALSRTLEGDMTCTAALDWSPSSSSKGDMHCGPGLVPVFLKERQSLQPQTGPGTWSGPSSNIRPRESGISHAQALPADQNRFAINGLGLRTASDHRETAGVAMPFRLSFPLVLFRFFPLFLGRGSVECRSRAKVAAGLEQSAGGACRKGPHPVFGLRA
jgi:hypothetical protein